MLLCCSRYSWRSGNRSELQITVTGISLLLSKWKPLGQFELHRLSLESIFMFDFIVM